MTVSVGPVKKIYQGNGLNRNWGITFPLLEASHLNVWVEREDGGSDLVDPSEYEVDINASKVIYPLGSKPALVNGKKIALIRKTPISQEIDIVKYGNFFPETVEGGLDRSILIDQELQEELSRAVKVPAIVDDPEEFGRGVLAATSEAKSSAERAASAAASASGYAGSAKSAKDQAEKEGLKAAEYSGIAEGAKNQAEREATRAVESAGVAEAAKNQVGNMLDEVSGLMAQKLEGKDLVAGSNMQINQENGKLIFSASGAGGGGSVVSVAGKLPDGSGNIPMASSDIGAAELNHLHTLQALGAASASHSHTAQDVGAATSSHNHDGVYIPKPSITSADAGKALLVKSDGSGWIVGAVSGGGVAGVSSLNGKTGVVTIAGSGIATVKETGSVLMVDVPAPVYPVTSVNGKTGAVVIATGGGDGGSVVSVAGKFPNETGNIALVASDIGAASSVHGHDYLPRPSINSSDVGKALVVKSDLSGFTLSNARVDGAGFRQWKSQDLQPVKGSRTALYHNLLLSPEDCLIILLVKCVKAEKGYAIDDYALSPMGTIDPLLGLYYPLTAHMTSTIASTITGDGGTGLSAKHPTGPGIVELTLANWRYVIRIWY